MINSGEHKQPSLRRSLGIWPAAAIVVGTVIGSGIFLVPSDMIRAVGSPARVFFVWIFGGVLSLFGALSYAELAAAMPEAGADYVYLKTAYGSFFAFAFGWTQTLVGKGASIAALGTAFFTYLADFFPKLNNVLYSAAVPIGPQGGPFEIHYGQIFAAVLILLLASVNYAGTRVGGSLQVLGTAIKVALIAGISITALASSHGSAANFRIGMIANPGGIAGFFAALVSALWAYDGWTNAALVGSEIEKPDRNLPRVLILGTAAVVAMYVLTNLAYFYVLSGPEVGSSARVAADAMRKAVGLSGGAIVSVAAMISIFAGLNGMILSGARLPYAMARDGYFFSFAKHVHPRFYTPSASLLGLGIWSAVLLFSGRFEDLYRMVIFTEWIFYALSATAVVVLRRKRPDLIRPYRVWGYPVVPVLFVLVSIALLYSTLVTYPRESGIGLGLILIGLPFYFHWAKRLKMIPDSVRQGDREL